MARLVFPDDRLVYRTSYSLSSAVAAIVLVYSDAAGTVLADIRVYDGTLTPGATIAGSSLTVDQYSQMPMFWGPDTLDVVYVRASGGPVTAVYARADDRIDANAAAIAANTAAIATNTASITAKTLADVAAVASASGALVAGRHNPVDATAGNLTMTLADATTAGQVVVIEKADATVNTVTITGNIRGTASSVVLVWQREAVELLSKAGGSWWPIAGHKTKSSLDAAYGLGATSVQQRSLIYHDPITKANGAITAGDVLDSGQAVVNNVGPNPLRYSGGQMVHTAGSINVANAGYLQTQVTTGVVRRVSAQAAWAANALGAIAIVIPSSLWNQSAPLLPVAGFHTTMYGNGIWVGGVYNPGVGSTGHVEAHMLNVLSGTALALSVTTTTPASTQATASLTVATMTAATLKAALEGLSNVGAGKVTVVGPFGGKYGIVWDSSLGVTTASISGSTGTPAPTVTKYTAGGVTTYADYTTNGRYTTCWDGTLKDFDVWLFPEVAQCIIYFPDGTNSGYITDPAINLWCGAGYAVHELFENNAGQVDVPATYGRIAVDNLRQRPDAFAMTKPDVTTVLNALAPLTLYEGANTTTTDITATGSIPAGTKWVEAIIIGGVSGSGSGACVASGTPGNGGGASGSAGIWREVIPASAFAGSTTWSVIVGKKGTGGIAVSSASVGNPGTVGGLSRAAVGPVVLQAFVGAIGAGGTTGATQGAAGGAGGPFASAGAAGGISGLVGNNGAGITATPGTPGSASGGGITAVPAANNGGVGGSNLLRGYTGGTAGIVGGALPGGGTDAAAALITGPTAGSPGCGVGGGAASITGAAQAGKTALGYGVGSSGGGASLVGFASGAGADGIGGYVLLRAHFF